MHTADFYTAWVIGIGGANEPEFLSAGLPVDYTDLTNQPAASLPPEPNGFVCRVNGDESDLDAIDALPNTSELAGTRERV
jgi:hypothetical protein